MQSLGIASHKSSCAPKEPSEEFLELNTGAAAIFIILIFGAALLDEPPKIDADFTIGGLLS